jgi:hypothetical protein
VDIVSIEIRKTESQDVTSDPFPQFRSASGCFGPNQFPPESSPAWLCRLGTDVHLCRVHLARTLSAFVDRSHEEVRLKVAVARLVDEVPGDPIPPTGNYTPFYANGNPLGRAIGVGDEDVHGI